MRYNQLMESTNISVRDLNLPPDFWESKVARLHDQRLDSLDGCPDEILGDFYCFSNDNLTSLSGGPKIVNGEFYCSGNKLTSLEYSPKTVGRDFDCSYNQLTSLNHTPTTIGGAFSCKGNLLTSLIHAPSTMNGTFNCSDNQLTSLIGSPETTGSGGFYCSNNHLTSLVDCPKTIGGGFECSNNRLTSLVDIHTHVQQMNGTLYISGNPITSHILGILLIQGCRGVVCDDHMSKKAKLLQQAVEILNEYLGQGRAGIMECQAEMLAAGLDDFAQI